MPDWVLNFLLPYVVPAIAAALGPSIVEYMKKAADYANVHLPKSVMVAIAAGVSSLVMAAQGALTGVSLPPLVQAFVPVFSIFLNELGKDFGKQPPTPGVA